MDSWRIFGGDKFFEVRIFEEISAEFFDGFLELGKFVEDFWRWGNSWRIFESGEILGGFLEVGKYLGDFWWCIGNFLENLQGAPGGQREEGLAMNMVHPLKPYRRLQLCTYAVYPLNYPVYRMQCIS